MSKFKLLVDNNSTFIEPDLPKHIYKVLRKDLGYTPEGAMFRGRFKGDGIESTICPNIWGRCGCSIKKAGTHFPSGIVSKAKETLDRVGIEYEVYDIRQKPMPNADFSLSEEVELRDYQKQVVYDGSKVSRGLIKMCTGSGKTPTCAALIVEKNVKPFIFYVTSTDLLKQAHAEFSKWLMSNGSPITVGMIGGGFRDIQDITIMTVQTACRAIEDGKKKKKTKSGKPKKEKFLEGDEENEEEGDDLGEFRENVRELIKESKGMICDEVQHWQAKTCQKIADYSVNCYHRFGCSATPYRDSGDDILIDACFGKPICNISASMMIQKGWLVRPSITFVPMENMHGIEWDTYAEAYKQGIVENTLRNEWLANMATALANDGRTVLCLVNHISHGECLESMIPGSVFLHGSHSSKERDVHLDSMRRREARITIASQIFDEGIDVRPLNALILGGSGKSSTRALQRIGRVLRPYSFGDFVKKDAVVVDFNDRMQYVSKHVARRRKIYKTEPEFIIKDMKF